MTNIKTMEGAPKYQPSEEKMNEVEELMGPKQKEASNLGEEIVEKLGSSDAEYINDLSKFEREKYGDGYKMHGTIKGHTVFVLEKDSKSSNRDNFICIVDGKELNQEDALKVGRKYSNFLSYGLSGFPKSLNALSAKEHMAKGELFQEEQYDQVVNDLLGKTSDGEE